MSGNTDGMCCLRSCFALSSLCFYSDRVTDREEREVKDQRCRETACEPVNVAVQQRDLECKMPSFRNHSEGKKNFGRWSLSISQSALFPVKSPPLRLSVNILLFSLECTLLMLLIPLIHLYLCKQRRSSFHSIDRWMHVCVCVNVHTHTHTHNH